MTESMQAMCCLGRKISRTPAVQPRFNERLVLSLASNPNCLLMDDELNVLPTSSPRQGHRARPARGGRPP